jgi:hypothetical protein
MDNPEVLRKRALWLYAMALQAGHAKLVVANELVALAISLEERASFMEQLAKALPAAEQVHQPAPQQQAQIQPRKRDE